MELKTIKQKTRLRAMTGFLLIGLFSGFSAFLFLSNANVTTPQYAEEDLPLRARRAKQELLNRITEYQTSAPEQQLAQLERIQQAVSAREHVLRQLVKDHPDIALKFAFPSSVLKQLPPVVQDRLEKAVEMEGVLSTIHGDDLERGIISEQFFLKTREGKRIPVLLSKELQGRKRPRDVRLFGVQVGDTLLAEGVTTLTLESEPQSIGPALGQRRVGIVLFNFQDDQSQPVSATTALERMFTNTYSVRAYYDEISNSQVSLTGKQNTNGDVYGYFTIPFNNQGCLLEDWSDAAALAAQNSGVDLSGYDHLAYVFPDTPDCLSGWSDIGGSRFWINGAHGYQWGTIAHELGHNLNFVHASSYRCTSGGQPVAISASCTTSEYGDLFDLMGISSRHIHAGRKTMAGWIPTGDTVEFSSAGTNTVTLRPMEQAGVSPKTVRIPFSFDDNQATRYYYLEYRQPYGQFDNFSPTDPVVKGVTIRIASKPELNSETGSLLIDTAPLTSTFADAPLQVGETFIDSARGISITVTQATSTSATVSITLSCARAAPLVTPFIFNQYGTSGAAKGYEFKVQNADSVACSPSVFSLRPTADLQPGWSQTPLPVTFELAPGHAASVPFTVTSAPIAAQGFYLVSETVKNENSPTMFTAKNIFYRVDNTPPTVTMGYLPTQVIEGQTVPLSVSVTDNEEVDHAEFWIGNTLLSSCTFPSGITSCSFPWVTQGWGGSRIVSVKALDKAGNNASVSAEIRVTYTPNSDRKKIKIEQ